MRIDPQGSGGDSAPACGQSAGGAPGEPVDRSFAAEGEGLPGEAPKARYHLAPSSEECPWNVVSCALEGVKAGDPPLILRIECEPGGMGIWRRWRISGVWELYLAG